MIVNVEGERLYFGYPQDDDIPALKAMWANCYPGDEEFCDYYFDNYYDKSKCVIVKNDEQIVCVAHFLYGHIVSDNKSAPVIYMYAGGTADNLRNKGYFKAFNDMLRDYCTDKGFAAYVFTANDGLEEMYDNMGYSRTSTLNVTYVLPDDNYEDNCLQHDDAVIQLCSYDDFVMMRNRYVEKHKNGLIWDDDVMSFLYKNYNETGGIYIIKYQEKSYYAVVTDMPDMIFIRETDVLPEYINIIITVLRGRLGNKKVKLYSGSEVIYDGYDYENIYYGHGRITGKGYSGQLLEDVYINLIEE